MSANNYLPRYFKEEGFWLKQEQKNNKKKGRVVEGREWDVDQVKHL